MKNVINGVPFSLTEDFQVNLLDDDGTVLTTCGTLPEALAFAGMIVQVSGLVSDSSNPVASLVKLNQIVSAKHAKLKAAAATQAAPAVQ